MKNFAQLFHLLMGHAVGHKSHAAGIAQMAAMSSLSNQSLSELKFPYFWWFVLSNGENCNWVLFLVVGVEVAFEAGELGALDCAV